MKAIIVRHAKVNYHWRRFYSSKEYDTACEEYDLSPVVPVKIDGLFSGCEDVWISTLRRTKDSAGCFFGTENTQKSELIDEVPRRSCFDTKLRLPTSFWNVTGRLQWLFGRIRQDEGIGETAERARAFIEMIIEKDRDCVVVTHGCYMQVLQRELKKAGFRFRYRFGIFRNGEYIIAKTEDTKLQKKDAQREKSPEGPGGKGTE